MLFVVRGAVRETRRSPAGRDVLFGEHTAGQIFAEPAVLDEEPWPVDSTAWIGLPARGFAIHRRLPRYPAGRGRHLLDLGCRVRDTPAPARLADGIVRPARDGRLPDPADIAHIIGTRREPLARELDDLARRGIFEPRRAERPLDKTGSDDVMSHSGPTKPPIQPTAQTLAGIELFRDLDHDERAAIAGRCHAHRYTAGEQVLAVDDPSRDVLFVVSGTVRVTLYSPQGKEVIFRDQTAGEMLGELAAIDGNPRSAHVLAEQDTLLVSLSPEHFRSVLEHHPDVNWRVLQRLVGLVRSLSERVYEFSTLQVPMRVRAELLRLARSHTTGENTARLDPAPTHAEIASTIGTHREAVTRELNDLAKRGVLTREGHAIVIHDVKALK